MNPMLLSEYPYYKKKVAGEKFVFIQPKLNGWRALINTKTGKIYSRKGNEIILPHISDDILKMSGLPEWIDGELYNNVDNNTVCSGIATQDKSIKFYCFDCIIPGLQESRIDRINKIRETENIRIVATYKIKPSEINKFYREYLNMGLEGAVVRLNTEYHHGRSDNILKIKPIYD